MTTILEETQDFLRTPLPLENKKMQSDLVTTEKLRVGLLNELQTAKMQFILDQARFRRPTEKGLTDFDRKIMLNELVAESQSKYETLAGISELLADRRTDLLTLLAL